MGDATKPFATVSNRAQIREILSSVYDSLMLKGYNPINQLVGYILSEDPTYITNYNNARSLICRIDRDELLQELVRSYLEDKESCDCDHRPVFYVMCWGRNIQDSSFMREESTELTENRDLLF